MIEKFLDTAEQIAANVSRRDFVTRLGAWSLGLAGFLGISRVSEADKDEQRCRTNSDCSGNEYCQKKAGKCGQKRGRCVRRPEACIQVYDPVCGCDGATYSNACFAAMAGVNVQHTGPCS